LTDCTFKLDFLVQFLTKMLGIIRPIIQKLTFNSLQAIHWKGCQTDCVRQCVPPLLCHICSSYT